MNKYMKIADELAQQNILTNDGGPFGAVIIKNNEIVGKGNNQVVLKNDPTAHAEIVAIRDACKNLGTFDLTGCEIYTSCYPCPMCLSAIIWSNIKMVYYGNTKEDAEKIGFRDNLIYEYLEGQSKTTNKEDILKIIAMDREETIKTFESYQNKSENKTMY
ncbi:MAG: nucleoside deaminase [Clostridia bacterium]|jgi:guanine deaminase|nr:nucleoside deaminase [Clostridia bacterium]HJJ09143.1 nucleoside deaminase [Clostridiaceae bacterium]